MKKLSKRKKVILFVFIAVIIISIGVVISMIFNPARLPKAQLRSYLLNITPIGMSIEKVEKIIESKEGWTNHETIYEKSLNAFMKPYATVYFFSIATHVYITWKFDDDLNLIDIDVKKSIDMP